MTTQAEIDEAKKALRLAWEPFIPDSSMRAALDAAARVREKATVQTPTREEIERICCDLDRITEISRDMRSGPGMEYSEKASDALRALSAERDQLAEFKTHWERSIPEGMRNASRYWEARWRDEKAERESLEAERDKLDLHWRSALERIADMETAESALREKCDEYFRRLKAMRTAVEAAGRQLGDGNRVLATKTVYDALEANRNSGT
jgi:DNA repair exonuclease SbcCD ATPase subunit